MSYYQLAPEGIWRSSPERIVLWAVQSVLHRIERDMPEARDIAKWQAKLAKALNDPVRSFKWETLWRPHIVKDDREQTTPTVPLEVATAWEKVPQMIVDDDGLWQTAGRTRTTAEGLPFDPAELGRAFDETSKLVKSIPGNTTDRLQTLIREAYAEQKGQFGFARSIRSEWSQVSKQKAEQIAVTEWNRAASGATYLGLVSQGVQSKVWFTVGDERVCELCEANGAMGEIPVAQEFFTGDLYPPAHPGCRCNVSGA